MDSVWTDFDGWCCTKGIDPLDLPAYRFFNLSIFYMQEGKDDEELVELENEFKRMDEIKHPLHVMVYKSDKPINKKVPVKPQAPSPPPVEEKYKFIPSWWRGDAQNYNVAKSVMKTLPK